jgi:hypothetical protein
MVLSANCRNEPFSNPSGPVHPYDYGVCGVQDMLTSRMPLMNIPVPIGGLAIQPGGHLGPPRPRPLSPSETDRPIPAFSPAGPDYAQLSSARFLNRARLPY